MKTDDMKERMKTEEFVKLVADQMDAATQSVIGNLVMFGGELSAQGLRPELMTHSMLASGYLQGILNAAEAAKLMAAKHPEVTIEEWAELMSAAVRRIERKHADAMGNVGSGKVEPERN